MYNLSIESQPKREDTDVIFNGLREYNRIHVGEIVFQPLAVFLRDENDQIAGGLTGGSWWGWLHIELLWLRDDCRGQGWGSALMAAAEDEAIQRGCKHVMVDTHDFQAPEFYVKLGYQPYAVLKDFPPGHERIFYQKTLNNG